MQKLSVDPLTKAFAAWFLPANAQATGDEDAVSDEEARTQRNQALINRDVVSAKVVANYEAAHRPAVGVSAPTPYEVAWYEAPANGRSRADVITVVRRTQSSGRPARSHSSRPATTRGSRTTPTYPKN